MAQNYNFWNFIVFLFYSACVFILREDTWLCKANSDAESSFCKWEFCFHIECNMLGLLIVENRGFIFFLAKKNQINPCLICFICAIFGQLCLTISVSYSYWQDIVTPRNISTSKWQTRVLWNFREHKPLSEWKYNFLWAIGEMCVWLLRSGTECIKAKGYSHTYSYTKLLITPDSLHQCDIWILLHSLSKSNRIIKC